MSNTYGRRKTEDGKCTSTAIIRRRLHINKNNMRTCLCKTWGPPSSLVIEDGLTVPTPKTGEVLIAVSACGVNYPDLLSIQGKYQVKPPLPFAPGGEIAGVVTALGDGCRSMEIPSYLNHQVSAAWRFINDWYLPRSEGQISVWVIRPSDLGELKPDTGCSIAKGIAQQKAVQGKRWFKEEARLRLGDRVVVFVGHGGFTTDLVVKENSVVPLPPGMDFITGASFGLAYGTADYALRVRAKVREGELVLVLGASGGVGLAAVQLAKAAGATVIAAASTGEKLKACQASGADFLLNYRQHEDGRKGKKRSRSWRDELKALVGGRGIDIVLDCVGGADCEIALRSMAVGGRYLVVGFASGTIPSPPLNLVLLKEACVIGIFWGAWVKRDPKGSADQMEDLVRLYTAGLIRPVISGVYPLDEAPRALEDMGARRVVGKLVIDCGGCGSQDGGREAIATYRQRAGMTSRL